MVKLLCRPTSSAWDRSIRAATLWKVPSQGIPSIAPPLIADTLSFISRAALLVKVTASIDDLIAGNEDLDLILVESGGDNLTATFSSGLVDVQIFVVDVAGGDKVPRKGGPGVTFSDLLVVNKTDLAPLVGADLDVMRRDAEAVRAGRPTELISLTADPTAAPVLSWVRQQLRVPV